MQSGQVCEDCLFGFPNGPKIECRRYPKVWCRNECEDGWWGYPTMGKDDNCGEFVFRSEENQAKFDMRILFRRS